MSPLIALALPILSLAQTAPVATPAPSPSPSPSPAPSPSPSPSPAPAPAPAPAPTYAPAPVYVATAAQRQRAGFTFEGSLGAGLLHANDGDDSDTRAALNGLNLGIGGFLDPSTALTLRIAASSFEEELFGIDVRYIALFVGPSVQRWVSDRAFVAGGVGLGAIGITASDDDELEHEFENGLGFDLRAGYDLVTGSHGALQVSVELSPQIHDDGVVTSLALQLGAQLF